MTNRWSGRAANALFSMMIFAGVSFFAWHAIQGDFGVFAMLRAENEAVKLREELAEVKAERIALANLTRRLNHDYLDPDMLDERARSVLGYMRPDEIRVDW